MLLTDLEGKVFDVDKKDIKEIHNRHGLNGDYTLISTDTQIYRAKESVSYIMGLLSKVK